MEKAIKLLETKRNDWIIKNEYYRVEMTKAHFDRNEDKKEEARQLMKLATDTIHGLDYTLAVLKGERA